MRLLIVCFALVAASASATTPYAPDPNKILRRMARVDFTGFDNAQVSDVMSTTVIEAIFDPPLRYDYLARPQKLKPNTAEAVPEPEDGGRTYTLKIRPGIYFADDPAFNGKKRELTAQDYVYSVKRVFDPKNKSPQLYLVEGKLVGMDAVMKEGRESGKFDYDREVEGIRALDRYTFQVKLNEPDYTFIYQFASTNVFVAMAREVVEKYGESIMEHPVGTGPFRLALWRRSSRVILEANPNFREFYFDGEPAPDDQSGQAILAKMKGKRIPQLARVELYVLEQPQPRWLAFLTKEHDYIEQVSDEFSTWGFPNGVLAPHLARQGVQIDRMEATEVIFNYFQMNDPVVGGYTPDRIAFRRALIHAYDSEKEIKVARKNMAVKAYGPVGPNVAGYDPNYRTNTMDYNPGKAKALLDMFDYKDCDGDGFREAPGCKPLTLEYASLPTSDYDILDSIWDQSMKAIGIRMKFKKMPWPDFIKSSRLGQLQMGGLAWTVNSPDAYFFFATLDGKSAGGSNHARFNLPAYNELFAKAAAIPPGQERDAIYLRMKNIFAAYAPWRVSSFRIHTSLSHPWVIGFKNHPSMWHEYVYMDLDVEMRDRLGRQ